jgi:glutathione synthase/RimK-type ligase-like ATP-grasp enzyme
MRIVSDKLKKTRVLCRCKEVRSFIPETRRMNRDVLLKMLHRNAMVYVKPCRGSLGNGVIRVEKVKSSKARKTRSQYRYQQGTRIRSFSGYDQTYSELNKETKGRPYLVQKGIKLLTHGGRPFDIRVMVQRTKQGNWVATGVVGRVAHPRKVVTNGSQGGSIYPVEDLLKPYATMKKRKALLASMRRIGVRTAQQLSSIYPGLQEIGADIAIDQELKQWILEVNTRPDPCPFAKLKDRSMLQRIIRYGKGYGRTYCLQCTKSKRGVL